MHHQLLWLSGRDTMNWSADETIAAIREQEITAKDYISGVLDRANRGKSLNAFISLMPDEAKSAADEIDKAIAQGGSLPPLAGLAVVAKDNINVAGLPTSAGTPALQFSRPNSTAPSLRKLIAAGAILIGKTNLHELALGITSTNLSPFAEPVHNPYEFNMIPGGSSGGTATAISAGIVSCGLGTDTGGSTRIPAALTGIVGMRPSVGDGGSERRYHDENAVVPISHTKDTIGAMGRTVADVALLDSVISDRPRVQAADIRGVRFGIPPSLWSGLDESLEEVVVQARDALEEAGAVMVSDDMPDLLALDEKLVSIAFHEPLADIPAYLKTSGILNVSLADIARDIASPDVKIIFDSIMNDDFGGEYDKAIKVHRPALQRMYADYFKATNVSAILFPTTILPAIPIDEEHGSGNVSINGGPPNQAFGVYISRTSPGSNAGIPGLSIPAGSTKNGLPVGLEIDGTLGSDERLLALGLTMEKVFGQLPRAKL